MGEGARIIMQIAMRLCISTEPLNSHLIGMDSYSGVRNVIFVLLPFSIKVS